MPGSGRIRPDPARHHCCATRALVFVLRCMLVPPVFEATFGAGLFDAGAAWAMVFGAGFAPCADAVFVAGACAGAALRAGARATAVARGTKTTAVVPAP